MATATGEMGIYDFHWRPHTVCHNRWYVSPFPLCLESACLHDRLIPLSFIFRPLFPPHVDPARHEWQFNTCFGAHPPFLISGRLAHRSSPTNHIMYQPYLRKPHIGADHRCSRRMRAVVGDSSSQTQRSYVAVSIHWGIVFICLTLTMSVLRHKTHCIVKLQVRNIHNINYRYLY